MKTRKKLKNNNIYMKTVREWRGERKREMTYSGVTFVKNNKNYVSFITLLLQKTYINEIKKTNKAITFYRTAKVLQKLIILYIFMHIQIYVSTSAIHFWKVWGSVHVKNLG